MADDWENEDWENEDNLTAQIQAAAAAAANATTSKFDTKGEEILATINQPDMSKFADEQTIAVDEVVHVVPKSQPKKKEEKKYTKGEVATEQPLDDPIAEKLRQQRLQEQADYESARELFGGEGSAKPMESYLPKTVKDFEEYAAELVNRYVTVHAENKNFKAFLKMLAKLACEPLTADETKDVETALAGLRSDKAKAEKAKAAEKKGVKKTLNVGKSAGLDDYIYDDLGQDDDYDFM